MLELVYAGNAVVHMLSGKAISRAVRGHFLVDAALNSMLLSSVLGIPLPEIVESDENSTGESSIPESAQTTESPAIDEYAQQHSIEEGIPESAQTTESRIGQKKGDAVDDFSDLKKMISEDEIESVRDLYKQLMNGTKSADVLSSDNTLKKICRIMENAR